MRTDYLAVALGAHPRAVGLGARAVGGLLRFVGVMMRISLGWRNPAAEGGRRAGSLDPDFSRGWGKARVH